MSDLRTRTYSWQDPMIGAGQALQLSGLDYMSAIARGEIPIAPIGATMNLTGIELVEHGKIIFVAEPAEFHYNPIGVVHGGFASTLLDSALGCAVHTTLPVGMAYTTLELHVNFIRAITKETGPLRCIAEVIHSGKQMATAQARVVDRNDKLYNHGSTTCLVYPISR
jgi:uncharacterized protein (TIGR00369 family)